MRLRKTFISTTIVQTLSTGNFWIRECFTRRRILIMRMCSLEEAQVSKLDRICRSLDLHPEERFLDVGCGWGGLVIHAAERFGAFATGCTLSQDQFEFARRP